MATNNKTAKETPKTEASTDISKMSLAAKLARIGKEIGAVDKTGKNSQQNYNYIEYGVVAGRIRELFDVYGIIIIPSVEGYSVDEITNKYGNKGYHYVLKMSFNIINADDPEDIKAAEWLGESADYGDKGINKAETSGTKYFLMRLFNVSEKGEDEADKTTPDISATQPKETPAAGNRVDFRQVREHLGEINSIEELNKYWNELHLTEKQAAILKSDFSERKVKIGVGVGA